MAYQSVGTPRFYINVVEWLHYSGWGNMPYTHLRTLPVLQNNFAVEPVISFGGALPSMHNSDKGFIALLGHTLGDSNVATTSAQETNSGATPDNMIIMSHTSEMKNIVNGGTGLQSGTGSSNYPLRELYNGFSIMEFTIDSHGLEAIELHSSPNIAHLGSLVLGTYYDMPQSPNLSLTMNMEYDGTKQITSYNGSSLSNTMWSRQPMWRDLGAWELHKSVYQAGRPPTLGICSLGDGNYVNLQQYDCEQFLGDWIYNPFSGPYCHLNGLEYDLQYLLSNEITPPVYYYSDDGIGYCTVDGVPLPPEVNDQTICEDTLGGTWTSSENFPEDHTWLEAWCGFEGGTYIDPALIEKVSGQKLARSGRKTWKLTFSYMDDADFWGSNQTLEEGAWGTITEEQGWDADDIDDQYNSLNKHLLNSDSFYAKVWHRTLNGALPFIFQPNNLDNTNFAIARFRTNTLKVTRTAFNVYDISVIIEEAW